MRTVVGGFTNELTMEEEFGLCVTGGRAEIGR